MSVANLQPCLAGKNCAVIRCTSAFLNHTFNYPPPLQLWLQRCVADSQSIYLRVFVYFTLHGYVSIFPTRTRYIIDFLNLKKSWRGLKCILLSPQIILIFLSAHSTRKSATIVSEETSLPIKISKHTSNTVYPYIVYRTYNFQNVVEKLL